MPNTASCRVTSIVHPLLGASGNENEMTCADYSPLFAELQNLECETRKVAGPGRCFLHGLPSVDECGPPIDRVSTLTRTGPVPPLRAGTPTRAGQCPRGPANLIKRDSTRLAGRDSHMRRGRATPLRTDTASQDMTLTPACHCGHDCHTALVAPDAMRASDAKQRCRCAERAVLRPQRVV